MRALAGVALLLALVLAPGAGAAPPQVRGTATIGGSTVTLRYATAFLRHSSGASGGYAVILSPTPVRCRDLTLLPASSPLRQPWALVALYPSKDGLPQTGRVAGEIDYPVGDAYASLARGVAIVLTAAQPFPGGTWRGHVIQQQRAVEGKRYALNAHFSARWCAT